MLVSQLEINMDPIRTLHPLARAWLLDGPLSTDLDAYLALLERGRYAEGSVEKHLRALAHFSHWMTRCRLATGQLDEDFVDQFLHGAAHARRPQCRAWTSADRPTAATRHRGTAIAYRPRCRGTVPL